MLKKRLGVEAIEREWNLHYHLSNHYFKIPSTLIIPESCEKIGFAAFRGCKELKKVVIPESVEEIGYCAFRNCTCLEEVVIPGSVEWIVDRSFEGCIDAVVILGKPRSEFKFIGRYRVFDDVKDVKEEIRS